ncbi:MAG: GMC family oxidoreductase [Actinomycetota bacterium]|nr:GMC family oxidoreductase [Actinomycetota bacterium]
MELTEKDVRTAAALASVLLPEGHGLPGADSIAFADRFRRRAQAWERHVGKQFALLLRSWNLSPLIAHRKTFVGLDRTTQASWVDACYHSRSALRRFHVAGLKQILFLVWASAAEVEEALGYDYSCRKDNVARGTLVDQQVIVPATASHDAPKDYYRFGPAIASGAVPQTRANTWTFDSRPPDDRRLETLSYPEVRDRAVLSADVVVIGSGAGGAVVATTLAEAGLDVIVVEEGFAPNDGDFNGPPFERFQQFCRDNGTTQAWGMPPIPLPMGKVLGGTTVVNSGTCFRAPDRILQRWHDEYGLNHTSATDLQQHYQDIEAFLNVRPVPWELLGPNGMAAHKGAVALGYSGGPLLRNIADCHGCGQCAFGCPTHAKQAMHVSYLPRAWRAGARIIEGCRVDRILTTGDVATGVVASLLDRTAKKRAEVWIKARQVVVSAGAVFSPALLMRSDVPDPSGQTGRNLRIHPATGVGGVMDDGGPYWKGTLQSYYIDQFFESHELMFEATTSVPGVGAGSLPGIGARAMLELADASNLATLGFYVSDTSSGRVFAPRKGGAVATYRLNDLDARRIALGLAVAAEVLLEAGARKLYLGVSGLDAPTPAEQVDQLRDKPLRSGNLRMTGFHPMGTIRMGADPQRSVVDAYGAHHQIAGLWVADASVFPSCVAVNPQMTIMALAKRTAEKIVALEKGDIGWQQPSRVVQSS